MGISLRETKSGKTGEQAMSDEPKDVQFGDPEVWKGFQYDDDADGPTMCIMRLLLPSGRTCSLEGDYPRAFEVVWDEKQVALGPVAGKAVFIKNTAYGPADPEHEQHAPITLEQIEAELDRLEKQHTCYEPNAPNFFPISGDGDDL
jgi:hypothetical protein